MSAYPKNASAEWWDGLLSPTAAGSAFVDAGNPVTAIRTHATVTLEARNSGSATGPDRRGRSAAITARKRAIERAPWTDDSDKLFSVRLELLGKVYSETHGFLHSSQFRYKIVRTYWG